MPIPGKDPFMVDVTAFTTARFSSYLMISVEMESCSLASWASLSLPPIFGKMFFTHFPSRS